MSKPLTPEQIKQLEQLRDIQLPEPISWWPLAWGWWMLIILILFIIITFVFWSINSKRKVKRDALNSLMNLEHRNPNLFATELSTLFKRVAMYRALNLESLTGQSWLDYLQNEGFTQEQANFIAFSPYAHSTEIPNVDALKKISAMWIRKQFKGVK